MTKSEKPSEEFLLAIRNARSEEAHCGFCERIHFSTDPSFTFNEGALEKLMEKHKKDPDKYILHAGYGVEWGHLDGRSYVLDCPCNSASKYEDLIWSHRHMIAEYFSAKSQRMAQQAKNAEKVSSTVNSSL